MRRANITTDGQSSGIVDPIRRRRIDVKMEDDRSTNITERIGRRNKLYGEGIYGNGPYGGVN